MFSPIIKLLIVGTGGFLGAISRYLVNIIIARLFAPVFPFGTLLVNVTGSFMISFFFMYAMHKYLLDDHWRLFLVIGFLGSFTTFSSLTWETDMFLQNGKWIYATSNLFINLLLGLGAVRLAILLTK